MSKKKEQNWAQKKKRNPLWSRLFNSARGKEFERSKELRKEMTQAELRLWEAIRNKKLGVKFRRQHPFWRFTLDFYCPKKCLAVELDGPIHNDPDRQEHDENRTAELQRMGIKVIRFRNEEVERDLPMVLKKIEDAL